MEISKVPRLSRKNRFKLNTEQAAIINKIVKIKELVVSKISKTCMSEIEKIHDYLEKVYVASCSSELCLRHLS